MLEFFLELIVLIMEQILQFWKIYSRYLVTNHLVDVDHRFFPTYTTAIHLAVDSGNEAVFEQLIALGCSVNVKVGHKFVIGYYWLYLLMIA